MKLFALTADNWKMDGGVAFGVVPKTIWSRLIEADHYNCVKITTRCLLIVHQDRLILIDAGLGNKRDEKYYKVRFRETEVDIINSLSNIGYTPESITDVVFTHLHDDHVGAATHWVDKTIKCTFPIAKYWISESHWNWALNANKREAAAFFADNLMPLQQSGRLQLLKSAEQPFHSISLRIFDGHTRGQIVPFIFYKDKVIVYMADFIPTSYNIALPYIPSVDVEPLKSLAEKELFLEEAVDKKYILMFEHDSEHECATLKRTEKGIVIDKTFKLNTI